MKFMLPTLSMLILISSCQNKKKSYSEIHSEIVTLDTHIDIPIKFEKDSTYKFSERHTFVQQRVRTDLPRMQDGELDAAVFAVWTPQGKRNEEANKKVKVKALKIISAIQKNVAETNQADIAKSTNDFHKITGSNKCAIFMGLENGYPIGNNILNVESFYKLGIRYITLCHTRDNDICDSSTDKSEDEGLTNFGVEVIKEMNRLGIIVDVSHISDSAFYNIMQLSKAPVIASHSNARALCNHPRNLTDNMIKLLAKKGGVVSVNFYAGYLKLAKRDTSIINKQIAKFSKKWKYLNKTEEGKIEFNKKMNYIKNKPHIPKGVNVEDLVDHIDYIVNLVGINHVGIGSDFDGGGGIEGLEDVSKMGNITKELVKRSYSQKDIQKIWSGNFLRVLKEVETFASLTKENIG